MTELQARAESIADEIVGPDLLWWHRQPAAQLYSVLNARLPSILETPLREAARALMPILQKYGYAQQRHAYRFYQLSFPQELLDEVNRYNALHPEGVELKQKLDSVKRAKAQSGAAELWKQA